MAEQLIIDLELEKPLTILLAEDDLGDAKMAKRTFKKANIANHIIHAIDGIEALEALRGENGKEKIEKPYALFIDLNMPRMGGIELISTLKKDAEFRNCKMFVLTTSKREEDVEAASQLNVDGYFLKEDAAVELPNLFAGSKNHWQLVDI